MKKSTTPAGVYIHTHTHTPIYLGAINNENKKNIKNENIELRNIKGITLIGLAITIIIIIIISGVTMAVLLGNNGLIKNVNEAVFKDKVVKYKENVELFIISKTINNQSDFDIAEYNYNYTNIEQVISDIDEEDKSKFEIQKGKFVYSGTSEEELSIALSCGVQEKTYTILERIKHKFSDNQKIIYVDYKKEDGQYYLDEEGNKLQWVVLYSGEEKDSKGNLLNKGNVEIISSTSAKNIILEGKEGFKDAIEILNKEAEKYLNLNSIAVRSVGSLPSNYAHLSKIEEKYIKYYAGTQAFKGLTSSHHNIDYNQMKKLGIEKIGNEYWLASRRLYNPKDNSHYRIYAISTIGRVIDKTLYNMKEEDYAYSNTSTLGFRPVIAINPSTEIISGKGTVNQPYQLKYK